ncbi:hypothetical protein DYBT9623_00226 [Dyadobacter sp. CECT 9623]|uniref:Planctomycete cytochrome C n=1 Tax=Dyadobacter linearis TaxID=2823330 RepID=A0ABM8UJ90_9BACT|nr:PSD1 and planctomycete cytochrome C domain-containing protein [Dyadobacter sp. CECT 9623]CAG5067505.1 hypothetical protein DYBT9623_00226 [Dyadobacter sp. CECT 9623]
MSAASPIKYIILSGIVILVAGLFWKGFGNKGVTADKGISYNYQVRPILSDKCFACHGPDANKREAGLRLDIAENAYSALEGKDKYAIVPGNPQASEVYKRITSTDPEYQMPTPGSHLGLLNENEIALIKNWISQGAKYEQHWAFTVPTQATLPEVLDEDWCKNEIDRFTLAKMDKAGLEPSEQAAKEHLLKRVSLDLTGLAPSLEMQEQFAKDDAPNAYEKIVDQLISEKAYGEKMAIHWLDVARFADSYGYQNDDVRTQWAWRDWVIHAFNGNIPYDKFLVWQLAGDLLPNPNKEQILATAFLRNHKITEEDGVIPEEYRVEYHLDKTKTFSSGILGLTVECAQCHDHKYDPVSQEDYYRLFAFFNTSKEKGFDGSAGSGPAKTPVLTITNSEAKNLLRFINTKDTSKIVVSVMGENDAPRATHILNRGVYDAPGKVVTASALPAVMRFDTNKYAQNRLGLAQWTTSKENPLTARVFVNQIWQEIFGRGLVKSTGDFGMQGELPSHPELLDWLAVDFMNHGWDIKRLVKQMVTSATYRQSSKSTKEKTDKDPENIYLARGARYRVPAESIRDIVLSTSGLLNYEIGGPSVKPYQPKGIWEATTANRGSLARYIQDKDSALYRRGLYTFIKLTLPPPSMVIFDASNRDHCEVKRQKTNTPLQALVMLNDPTVLEASRVLAERLSMSPVAVENQIKEVFQRVVCRKPNAGEVKLLTDYYHEELATFSKHKTKAGAALNVGDSKHEPKADQVKAAALMRVISTIYNMEETITKS